MATQADSFDYIVTGAGSAGCAVAARLSESGRYRVLLLEAGGKDRNPWIHIPMGFSQLYADPRVNWMYESEPEAQLGGRRLYQPRGKVLGGTSSINGMVYMRGNAADYDEWRQRGCTGWDWDSVLPYFKKAEHQERGAERVPRRRRSAACVRSAASIGTGGSGGGSGDPGGSAADRRLQRRPPGGRGIFPEHHRQAAPLEYRDRLSASGTRPRQPCGASERACHAHPDRERSRRRRRLRQ